MRSIGALLDRRRRRRTASVSGGDNDYDIRIVHAYRDPRAVAASRHGQGDPLLGKHAAFVVDSDPDESIVREARMYCRTAVDDFRYRADVVDRRHPGVLASLDFDAAVGDVVGTVADVYRFAVGGGDGAPVPSVVDRWARDEDRKSSRASTWRGKMSVELSDRILALDECAALCRYIGCR